MPPSRTGYGSGLIAVGDFAMAGLMRFCNDPAPAALAALRKGPGSSPISGWSHGIQKKGHQSDVLCALDYGAEIAREQGITRKFGRACWRSATASRAIVVIGNAPSPCSPSAA